MKIAITGAHGMLGKDLVKVLGEDHNIYPVQYDITDFWGMVDGIFTQHPQVIIHSAAYTNVEEAEEHPDLAYKVNGVGTANIAKIASMVDARLFVISTDYVFDGQKDTPYEEFDTPNPINVYGKSKLLGEKLAMMNCRNCSIVRTQLLYGKSKPNIVSKFMDKAYKGEKCYAVSSQYTTPTHTKDVAKKINELLKIPVSSIYHISNSGCCSIYELACFIYEALGADKNLVNYISYDAYPSKVYRPRYSVLSKGMIQDVGLAEMRDWKEALEDYIEEERIR